MSTPTSPASEPVVAPITAALARFRAELHGARTPRLYSGLVHFWINTTICVVAIAACAAAVRAPSWLELLWVPAAFVYGNLAEYLVHRFLMHRKTRLLGILYERHHVEHHHFFTPDAMGAETRRDYFFILYPPILGLVVFLGVLGAPWAVLLHEVASPNAGLLFFLTLLAYFLVYEWLELAYHSPAGAWTRRLPFVGALARHHTDHHKRPTKANFNVTWPLFDRLFGTMYEPEK